MTLLTYAAAHAVVTVAPGPIMAVVITRTLTGDIDGAAGFTAGVCLGKVIAILAISVGIGVWAADSAQLLGFFQFAGAAYLLWLAAQMWQSVHIDLRLERSRRGWIGATTAGAAFSLCSPFTFLFYLMVLPSVIPSGMNNPSALTVVVMATVAVVGGVLTAVMLLAHQFRNIVSSPGASLAFSRGMAVLLVGTSVSLLML
jgi:threonine/homoserine/homoserine lactone efflux protein